MEWSFVKYWHFSKIEPFFLSLGDENTRVPFPLVSSKDRPNWPFTFARVNSTIRPSFLSLFTRLRTLSSNPLLPVYHLCLSSLRFGQCLSSRNGIRRYTVREYSLGWNAPERHLVNSPSVLRDRKLTIIFICAYRHC